MTREEAIQVLNMVEAHGLADEAKRMAIEALERESSEASINRQDAIEAVRLKSAKHLLIRLKSGREFRLTCSSYEIYTHKIDNSLCDFTWNNGTGECPRWLDVRQIEAIIEEK